MFDSWRRRRSLMRLSGSYLASSVSGPYLMQGNNHTSKFRNSTEYSAALR